MKTVVFTPFHSELDLWNVCLPDCYVFVCMYLCSSSSYVCDNWKLSKIKSMVITTSSNLECNYTVDTVTLLGQWLRSKSIRLWFEWNELSDWFMYVKWRAERRTKRNHRVWERVSRGVGDIWMKHGPLMGEGEYWIRQR